MSVLASHSADTAVPESAIETPAERFTNSRGTEQDAQVSFFPASLFLSWTYICLHPLAKEACNTQCWALMLTLLRQMHKCGLARPAARDTIGIMQAKVSALGV